jgi:hypothetical protein
MQRTVVVFTPCCGMRILLRPDEAVPGAGVGAAGARGGVGWLGGLVADSATESGLRAIWSAPTTQPDAS